MNGAIEALHILDERNCPLLSHTYTSRPLKATQLLPLYLDHPPPRPSLIYLPNTNPATLVFSIQYAKLLFLATASSEVEPLLALEFLYRVVDALEDFLGAPLSAPKIERSYDVVAQLLTELCDAGTVNTTEINALRDLVEVEGIMGKLLAGLSLPSAATSLSGPAITTAPALPWRRANVRHTSNELYVDVIETLHVTLAPSGRPLAAFANGTIAFTCKVSGVPDMTVSLTGPTDRHQLAGLMELPVFHPCVRLARWKERPGELSFIPPDGRFVLAGYEVDLLRARTKSEEKSGTWFATPGAHQALELPVELNIRTGLGPSGCEFEVQVRVNKVAGALRRPAVSGRALGGPHAGTPASPCLQDLSVVVTLPAGVRTLTDIRPNKGDATCGSGSGRLEWTIPNRELVAGACSFGLRCAVVGQTSDGGANEASSSAIPAGFGSAKTAGGASRGGQSVHRNDEGAADTGGRRAAQNRLLMPSSASVSFVVRGWVPSGIKVERIVLDARKSRGLGEAVKPYKGVKYVTVSKGGLDRRC